MNQGVRPTTGRNAKPGLMLRPLHATGAFWRCDIIAELCEYRCLVCSAVCWPLSSLPPARNKLPPLSRCGSWCLIQPRSRLASGQNSRKAPISPCSLARNPWMLHRWMAACWAKSIPPHCAKRSEPPCEGSPPVRFRRCSGFLPVSQSSRCWRRTNSPESQSPSAPARPPFAPKAASGLT